MEKGDWLSLKQLASGTAVQWLLGRNLVTKLAVVWASEKNYTPSGWLELEF